jgi:hypothetical protein
LVYYLNTTGATRFIELRLVNNATGEVLVYQKILTTDASGFRTHSFVKPIQDCVLEFQLRKETSNGVGATIETAALEFDFSIF